MRPHVTYEPIAPVSRRSAPRAAIVLRVTRDDDNTVTAFWLSVPAVCREWARPAVGESAREAQKRAFRNRILPELAASLADALFDNGEVTLALEGR